jgi:hypothetical protein
MPTVSGSSVKSMVIATSGALRADILPLLSRQRTR